MKKVQNVGTKSAFTPFFVLYYCLYMLVCTVKSYSVTSMLHKILFGSLENFERIIIP